MGTRLRHSPTAARAVIPAAGARAGARARRGGARRGAGRRRPAEGRALGGAAPLRAGRAPLPPRPKARRRRRPPRPRPAEQPLIPPPRPAHSPRPSSGRSPAGRAERGDEHGAVPGQLALRLLAERDGGAHLRLLHHHRLQGAQRARQHRHLPGHAVSAGGEGPLMVGGGVKGRAR